MLLCLTLLVGCQNAPGQFSLYAPFGPAVVPQPALSRANSTPYYTPPSTPFGAGSTPATASGPNDNKLSHYDPHTGILVPGNFTPPAIAARSSDAWSDSTSLAGSPPRLRSSNEEAIRVVDADTSPRGLTSAISSGFTEATNGRSSSVKFQASPPSGVVRTGSALLPPPENPISIAAVPKPAATTTTAPTVIPTTRSPASTNPIFSTPVPGFLAPPPSALPATGQPAQPTIIPAKPADGRKLSLWDDPGDGSRVMPAAHVENAEPASAAAGSWRAR
ncbi:hypothetical protein ETAA8_66450 [Anatilimnocola aggregata]|uniref:Uncharacterized protein n=2 Tax=Anatilimnocola aggregata TaxID=2528021 RepID=A0A517YMP0_9BACT|nr:hypothetical protein ETAA8_66450 [Anatilimnocola aggregata]